MSGSRGPQGPLRTSGGMSRLSHTGSLEHSVVQDQRSKGESPADRTLGAFLGFLRGSLKGNHLGGLGGPASFHLGLSGWRGPLRVLLGSCRGPSGELRGSCEGLEGVPPNPLQKCSTPTVYRAAPHSPRRGSPGATITPSGSTPPRNPLLSQR